jgi:hypothetical protein
VRRAAACLLLMVAAGARAELPPPGDCAGVYWDLTAAFEAGDRIYARVLLSRIGPGELSAAGQGHWIAPDGAATDFQNGRRAGRFEMDPTGRRLHIGSTTLDLTAATHRLGVDNDKRGVKLRVSVAAADAVSLPIQSGDLAVEVVLHAARLLLQSIIQSSAYRTNLCPRRSNSLSNSLSMILLSSGLNGPP